MSDKECRVFYKVSDPSKASEGLSRYKKYVDGLAFDEENIGALKDLLSIAEKIYGDKCEILLMESKETLVYALNTLGKSKSRILIALNELKDLAELRQVYGNYKNMEFGVRVTKPTLNLMHLARQGIKFVVIPPTLIRGRLISEAKARKISVIAHPVNDVATYVKLLELGVSAVVTTNPAVKRGAKKLLRL